MSRACSTLEHHSRTPGRVEAENDVGRLNADSWDLGVILVSSVSSFETFSRR